MQNQQGELEVYEELYTVIRIFASFSLMLPPLNASSILKSHEICYRRGRDNLELNLRIHKSETPRPTGASYSTPIPYPYSR